MAERAPDDDIGRCIDAAAVLYELARRYTTELEAHAHDKDDVTLGALIHLVVVTWIDRLADEGLTDRESTESQMISEAMARIAARADAAREIRARVAS